MSFDGSGSTDPDPGDSLSYAWDLDGDGQYDDSTAVTPSRTYATPGNTTVRLRVSDGDGASDISDPITISANNTAPTVFIDAPTAGTEWGVDQQIAFSGHATDPQQGTLPATAMSWSIRIQHCPSNCHQHSVQSWPGVASGSFDAPDHEYPSHLELTVTATDSGGLTDSETLQLDPRTVDLTFASSPSGVPLTVGGGTSQAAPFTRTVIEGSRNSISAPASTAGHWFSSWSDGGSLAHDVVPSSDATYTATYTPNLPPVAHAEAAPAGGAAPLDVGFSAAGSSDPDPPDSVVAHAWDLDGDGDFDDSTSAEPSRSYDVGSHTVRLRVTDEMGATDTDQVTITAGNTPPVATIDGPAVATSWEVGETIEFWGHADDQQDPGSIDLSWRIDRCDPQLCELIRAAAGPGGSFAAPDVPYPSWIEIRLTATDAHGMTATAMRRLDPRTVQLLFRSAPVRGVELSYDGASSPSGFSRTAVVGSTHSIRAPARVRREGSIRVFRRWSDGGSRLHPIVAGPVDQVLKATYRRPRGR